MFMSFLKGYVAIEPYFVAPFQAIHLWLSAMDPPTPNIQETTNALGDIHTIQGIRLCGV